LTDATVYLVPIGGGRFELYTEPLDETTDETGGDVWNRWKRRAQDRWRHMIQAAHAGGATGRLARARDWTVCRIAESIVEQRTLWSLRGVASASMVYPDDLSDASAASARARLLEGSSRHHRRWLIANLAGLALTAALFLLPGPNFVGYYFLFRVVGHFLAWRGARQAIDRTSWSGRAEPALTKLGALARRSREERAEEVERLAQGLELPRLAAFFDHVARPAR
jgi:hypothetical protein